MRHHPSRRGLLAAACLALGSGPLGALAQGYPSRPVTIVVPFPAGALADISARLLQEPLRLGLGQPVLIENRPGAAGTTGSAAAARAEPDGHTLLLTVNGTVTLNPFLQRNYPFDPLTGLSPITVIAATPLALAVNKNLPVASVADLLAHARAQPGGLNYGTAGLGSTHHIAGELLGQKTGISLTPVHYRGGGAAATDLVAGHVPVAFGTLVTLNAFAKADQVRVLAITEAQRDPNAPDIPTLAETIPGLVLTTWVGLSAPAGTPPAVIERINGIVTAALRTDAVAGKLKEQFATPVGNAPAEMGALMAEEVARHREIVRAANIQPE